jgi:hypothetical protein
MMQWRIKLTVITHPTKSSLGLLTIELTCQIIIKTGNLFLSV